MIAWLVLAGCENKKIGHWIVDPEFPLEGAHAAMPCEGCHGEGTPQALPTLCIDCHADDTPTPDHFRGQDCGECHTAYGWDQFGDADTDADADSDADADTDSDADGDPGFDHSGLPADTLCGDCHEGVRKDADHYTDGGPWDCAPCHQTTGWGDSPYPHPARIPHAAAAPESSWIIACTNCHPGGDTSEFDCSGCHGAIFPHFPPASSPGDAANASCLGCHPGAEL
ncbi:MAG: cytochrome c3 family protein [Myxococcota bacterium]